MVVCWLFVCLFFCCFVFYVGSVFFVFFFFSSRRRHTRWNCDWSSDVCSSDLTRPERPGKMGQAHPRRLTGCAGPAAGPTQLRVFRRTLPIPHGRAGRQAKQIAQIRRVRDRSEEHTSELQSQFHLVCRLLLEKK